ncbi:MAG: isocitrate/isopropylmalate family dehydrogenase [Candidatus Marinimicrobia bacterium]|nr:isocitrate/isopropylmalate family dehydrogenase [Candidatus Neomarinimicrobiota bacterium]
MSSRRIAIIPGDGVGPEIFAQVTKVIDALNRKWISEIDAKIYPYSAENYLRTRITISDSFLDEVHKNFDAVFVGPFGDPRVPDNHHGREIVNRIREKLDLNLTIYPIKLYADWLCPIPDLHDKNINLIIIKENMEYNESLISSLTNQGRSTELALETKVFTFHRTEIYFREALTIAQKLGRNRVCLVDKSNVFPSSRILFQRALESIEKDFPELTVSYLTADLAFYELLESPSKFDVIVSNGLSGDELFQISTFLTGGHGLSYSCEIGSERQVMYRVMQNSSPRLVGHDSANPLGAILALSRLLKQFHLLQESKIVENAVQDLLVQKAVTLDLNGILTTQETGFRIVDFINAN